MIKVILMAVLFFMSGVAVAQSPETCAEQYKVGGNGWLCQGLCAEGTGKNDF